MLTQTNGERKESIINVTENIILLREIKISGTYAVEYEY